MNARKQYLEEVRKEYAGAGEKVRSRLLDEAQKRTKLNRKYLIRVLNAEPAPPGSKRRKRKAQYGAALTTALVEAWDIFEQPCGQRLAPILKREVSRLRNLGELKCTDTVAQQLTKISSSTIDRLLVREKRVRMLRRNRNPNAQRAIYKKVPVKVVSEWDTNELGNVQVDFVAHCGRSTGGDYIHTLSLVDIATNWWEGVAIPVRSQHATKTGLDAAQPRFPFKIREIHPDNDSVLVNDLLWGWCKDHRIRMSRSRPYMKNDNAWVEQKNWTHVRKIVGYRRFDTNVELNLLNEIYALLRLYKNFFLPTIKLTSKVRDGGKIKRTYGKPQTPHQRVLASEQVSRAQKAELRKLYELLNPADLSRQITKLKKKLEEIGEGKVEVEKKVRRHGPALEIRKRFAQGRVG